MPPLSIGEKKKYYKKVKELDKHIKKFIKSKHPELVVYGSRALNAFAKKFGADYLATHTDDWDIYSIDYKDMDNELEAHLDKAFGADYFESEPAKHLGTQKVRSKVTGKGVADFSEPTRPVKYTTIGGINYVHPDERLKDIKRSLGEPESFFRHRKDKEAQGRIKILIEEAGPSIKKDIKIAFEEV